MKRTSKRSEQRLFREEVLSFTHEKAKAFSLLFVPPAEGGGMEIRMALITKIKEYREQTGMKQSELAEKVGARRETIVHLENGKYNPSLKLAMDIAKVFGMTVEEMFMFVDEEEA